MGVAVGVGDPGDSVTRNEAVAVCDEVANSVWEAVRVFGSDTEHVHVSGWVREGVADAE